MYISYNLVTIYGYYLHVILNVLSFLHGICNQVLRKGTAEHWCIHTLYVFLKIENAYIFCNTLCSKNTKDLAPLEQNELVGIMFDPGIAMHITCGKITPTKK